MKNRFNGKLLFIDTETGGVNPDKHSLLSVGLVAWDIDAGIIDKRELLIKHSEYKVTKSALRVNKINLEEHDLTAITGTEAIKEIDEFCEKNFPKDHKVVVAGHNIIFDIGFIKSLLSANGRSFENMFSHRSIDTASILQFLQISGKLSIGINSSSEGFKFFGIEVDNRHSALSDSIATAQLFDKMLEFIKNA